MYNDRLFKLAKEEYKNQNYKEYLRLMKELHSLEPNNVAIRFEFGKALIKNGEYRHAEEILTGLLDTKNWVYAMTELATIDKHYGNLAGAQEKLETVVSNRPDDYFSKLELGRIYSRVRKLDEAYEQFNDLIGTKFELSALIEIARIKIIEKDYTDAIDKINGIINSTKDKKTLSKALSLLGSIYYEKQDYYKAIECYKKACNCYFIAKNKFDLARMYSLIGDKTAAVDTYLELWDMNKHIPSAIEVLRIYREQGKLDKLYRLASEIKDKHFYNDVNIEVAKAKIREEKRNEGIKILRNMWEETKDSRALLELAKERMFLGKIDEGIDLINQYDKKDDDFNFNLELVKCYLYKGDYNKSLEILENIFQNKNNELYLKYKSFAYCRLKKYQEAYDLVKDIKKANSSFKYTEFQRYVFYLKTKIGIATEEDNTDHYSYTQIIKYNKESAIEHTKTHLVDMEYKKKHGLFNEEMNLDDLFNYISEKIIDMEPVYREVCDRYTFYFDEPIGNVRGTEIFRLSVVTFPDEKNILTMYPDQILDDKDLERDINLHKSKVRRLSNIEKFNKKYGFSNN